MIQAQASIDLHTMLCTLLRNDLKFDDVNESPKRSSVSGNDIARIFAWLIVTAQVSSPGSDGFLMLTLPEDLDCETRARLFHERAHFWQLIGSPLLCVRFLFVLERMKSLTVVNGGVGDAFVSMTDPSKHIPFEAIDQLIAEMNASIDWCEPHQITILAKDRAFTAPSVEQAFINLSSGQNDFVPGYAGIFEVDGRSYVLPFTAAALMESAASAVQQIYQGKGIAPCSGALSEEDLMYQGSFEYWRQLHGSKYDSNEALLLAFLAVVDLTLLGDACNDDVVVGSSRSLSHDDFEQQRNISYRFGKLAFRAQAFAPLIVDGSPDQAIAAYQNSLCTAFGWPTPDQVLKRFALYLTRLLAQLSTIKPLRDDDFRVSYERLFSNPLQNLQKDVNFLWPIWNALRAEELAGAI